MCRQLMMIVCLRAPRARPLAAAGAEALVLSGEVGAAVGAGGGERCFLEGGAEPLGGFAGASGAGFAGGAVVAGALAGPVRIRRPSARASRSGTGSASASFSEIDPRVVVCDCVEQLLAEHCANSDCSVSFLELRIFDDVEVGAVKDTFSDARV